MGFKGECNKVYLFFVPLVYGYQEYLAQLSKELHKPVKKKFDKREILVPEMDHTWSCDLADMSHWKKENHGYTFVLTVVDIFTRYAWAVALKSKSAEVVKDAFA